MILRCGDSLCTKQSLGPAYSVDIRHPMCAACDGIVGWGVCLHVSRQKGHSAGRRRGRKQLGLHLFPELPDP